MQGEWVLSRARHLRARSLICFLAILLAIPLYSSPASAATTFTVNSTGDPGISGCDVTECTLREAITSANGTPGADIIEFAIPPVDTVVTITPASSLPAITDPVSIDGTTQCQLCATPPVVLDGSVASSGFTNGLQILSAGTGSTVRGLVINNWDPGIGIHVASSDGNTIAGNFIGTTQTGTAAAPNGILGIAIDFGDANVIGGTTPDDRNLISGNGAYGVSIAGDMTDPTFGNQVIGNYIGTNAAGDAPIPNVNGVVFAGVASFNTVGGTSPEERNLISGNSDAGVQIGSSPPADDSGNSIIGNFIGTNTAGDEALANGTGVRISFSTSLSEVDNNFVGGGTEGERNVISGNTFAGVRIEESINNVVKGNYVGTNESGTAALPNGNGISLAGVTETNSFNRIGGFDQGEGNVVSGNTGAGIRIEQQSAFNTIKGNFIGTGPDGATPMGNGGQGIDVESRDTTVGGVGDGEGNVIRYNSGDGIEVETVGIDAIRNTVRGNFVDNNVGLGIDLGADGVTPNDDGASPPPPLPDADTGANELQNFPVITGTTTLSDQRHVSGELRSTPDTSFTVDVYSLPACDSSGHGEGLSYLGSASAPTDSQGFASWMATGLPIFPGQDQIAVTATNDLTGDTSEFSGCVGIAPQLAPLTFTVNSENDPGFGNCDATECTLREAILASNAAAPDDTIAFDMPVNGSTWIISPQTPLPAITDTVTIDGYSQPGAEPAVDPTPADIRVAVDGSAVDDDGLTFDAGSDASVLKGLAINSFGGNGIRILGGAEGVVIQGNYIGTDHEGTLDLGNGASGVSDTFHSTGPPALIGGTTAAERNVISGNDFLGVRTGEGTTVQGNYIGTQADGSAPLGNAWSGVGTGNSDDALIGGTTAGTGNVIAFNGTNPDADNRDGVTIRSNSNQGHRILGNSIHDNAALGIDLVRVSGESFITGVSPNDTDDPDTNGGNNLQNFPVVTFATGNTTNGTLNSTPDTTFRIEVFFNPAAASCDESGFGEGETFVGSTTATTNSGGDTSWSVVTSELYDGSQEITATATDMSTDDTSEFSACAQPALAPAGTFIVNSEGDESDDSDGDGFCVTASGSCTLRAAIEESNAFSGVNTINFNIPGAGPHTITPTVPLPDVIADGVVIDGYTEPGSAPPSGGTPATLMIELEGSAASCPADGLRILATSTVRGLVINNWCDNGIYLRADNSTIEGNHIGTNVAGDAAVPNGNDGIHLEIASTNTIGGTTDGARNVISGNTGDGIDVVADTDDPSDLLVGPSNGNLIYGNYVGVDATGTSALGNGGNGIEIRGDGSAASNNDIGASSGSARNIISGNEVGGIDIVGPAATENVVRGNYIGTDVTGDIAIGNATGIAICCSEVESGTNNVIGGDTPGAGNVISGNTDFGIAINASQNHIEGNFIGTNAAGTAALGNGHNGIRLAFHDVFGTGVFNTIGDTTGNVISANGVDGVDSAGIIVLDNADGTTIQSNFIGTGADGTGSIPNNGYGVLFSGASDSTIGPVTEANGNVIRNNTKDGVAIEVGLLSGADQVTVVENSIDDNGELGIDLGADGVTPNDAGSPSPSPQPDSDTGANDLQNFPVIEAVFDSDGEVTILGSLNSTPFTTFDLHFYSSPACDPSGFGEGQTFLDSTSVTTDGDGNDSFEVETFLPSGEPAITATATDPAGSTSEFSNCELAVTPRSLVVTKSGSGTGTVTSSPAGIDCGDDCDETYGDGTSVTLTATPDSGSTFVGFTGCDSVSENECTVAMNADRSVDAEFSLDRTLTVTKSGSGSGTVTSNPAGIDCGDDCSETYTEGTSVTLTATPDPGSTFVGFTGCDSVSGNQCTVAMNADRSVDAEFSLDRTLTVTKSGTGSGTVTSNPTGIDCGGDCSETYAEGTSVTLTATPSGGSTFSGWTGCDSVSGNQCTVTMSSDRTVNANFSPLTRTLTVTKSGSGSGTVTSSPAGIDCGADCSESYPDGTPVTLTASPSGGSTFAGWTGCDSVSGNQCNVTMNAFRTVNAAFNTSGGGGGGGGGAPTTRNLVVTKSGTGSGSVTSSPAGIDCGADCSEAYPDGQSVTLTATAASGSSFNGFTGCDSVSGNQCTVAMNADRSVNAVFNSATRALSVTKSGTGSGTVTSSPAGIDCGADCTENYANGTSVTLTAAPASGSTFGGFGGCDSVSGNQCTLVMNADRSVNATFTAPEASPSPSPSPSPSASQPPGDGCDQQSHICGTDGDDNITVAPTGDANVIVDAGAGNDTILVKPKAGPGDVQTILVNAGCGRDHIILDLSDVQEGASINIVLLGQCDDDQIDLPPLLPEGVIVDADGGDGDDVIVAGGAGQTQGQSVAQRSTAEPHVPDPGGYTIDAGGGDDEVIAGLGGDVVLGGPGSDDIDGGAGNDDIDTGEGSQNFVRGGGGNDMIRSKGVGDRAVGGEGNDTIRSKGVEGRAVGGEGDDTIRSKGVEGRAVGGEGDDTIRSKGINDRLIGGNGNDTIRSKGIAGRVQAGRGDDFIVASRGDDTVFGGAGHDTISLLDGNDKAFGGPGDDLLDGGPGNDILDGGEGADACFSGTGRNQLRSCES